MHKQTHEAYVHAVAKIAIAHLEDAAERERCEAIKLVYGAGQSGLRGVTYYSSWQNGHPASNPFVEICAFGQESHIQVAGTTIHELGHVLAVGDGHGKGWKDACGRLGLRRVHAAGTNYLWANFHPQVRLAIAALAPPDEGAPCRQLTGGFGGLPVNFKIKPCGAGIGTKGGKSRGAGSGSRLRLWECGCEPPVKVRIGRDVFNAQCLDCDSPFHCA